jgi:hypothetical protein
MPPGSASHALSPALTRAILVGAVSWTLLWLVPWQKSVPSWPWVWTVSALLLFSVPGAGLHAWLIGGDASPIVARLSHGFVLSAALTGLFGLLGRTLHLPFTFVVGAMWLAGLFAVSVLVRNAMTGTLHAREAEPGHWLHLAPGMVAALVAARLAFAPAGGVDGLTNVAFVYKFLRSDQLGFDSVAFGDEVVVSPRHWLSHWMLCEAVLAWKSGIPPLELVTNYLAPPLAVMSFACILTLCNRMGWGRQTASLALVG